MGPVMGGDLGRPAADAENSSCWGAHTGTGGQHSEQSQPGGCMETPSTVGHGAGSGLVSVHGGSFA